MQHMFKQKTEFPDEEILHVSIKKNFDPTFVEVFRNLWQDNNSLYNSVYVFVG